MSGFIKTGDELDPQELRVMIFSNRYKNENEKAPDFVIYQSEPMEQKPAKKAVQAVQAEQVEEESSENLEDLEELLK